MKPNQQVFFYIDGVDGKRQQKKRQWWWGMGIGMGINRITAIGAYVGQFF